MSSPHRHQNGPATMAGLERRVGSRGFTMAEVLVVVTLFGILAVAASPTFVRLLRDRRVNRAAMHLVDIYRTARTRAMGRGQPTLVRWTQSGATGRAQLLEPILVLATPATPNPNKYNCQTTAWANTANVQEFYRIELNQAAYELAEETFQDDGTPAVTQPFAEICFTPMGRTYIRTTTGDAFRPMTGVASFTVKNKETQLPRMVFIPPNGVARLQL